jgi:methylated-DNA-protein-cysteine methyltransferase related protein
MPPARRMPGRAARNRRPARSVPGSSVGTGPHTVRYHPHMTSQAESVHRVVRGIPVGRVVTYGAVARRAGLRSARIVGQVLAGAGDDGVPWHRVVNGRGMISLPGASGRRQRALLEAEGVRFDLRGRIDLDVFGWHDDAPLR